MNSSVGGSNTTPVELTPSSCATGFTQTIKVKFTITGTQDGTATFDVNTKWTYNGSTWIPSSPITVAPIGPRASGRGAPPPDVREVDITIENGSAANSGTSSFALVPFNVVNSNATGAKLSTSGASVTVHVAFIGCATVQNTAPVLVVPSDMTVEATSSAGAVVDFSASVSATDAEDGDITSAVICTPASGSTFALGETTVTCSVTDNGGLTVQASFKITVVDTTPATFTSFPSGTVTLIAANISGAQLDITTLGITVADVGGVSEPATFSCDYVTGTWLAIGSTTSVGCKAKDAIGNEQPNATYFDVFVTLNVSGIGGFLPPLRMTAPFSTHKRGSTIPHKFAPPSYADGTPATDLAAGLRLVITHQGGVGGDDVEANDYSAGSTAWRYDPLEGHYIFNLKTLNSWLEGSWVSTVSFAGIDLASTTFVLKK